MSDLAALDWRGTVEAAVQATLAGGASECDVLVLRRSISAEDAPPLDPEKARREEEGVHSTKEELPMEGGGVSGGGWRNRGGAWTKRFVGSVRRDGRVVLKPASAVGGREGEESGVVAL